MKTKLKPLVLALLFSATAFTTNAAMISSQPAETKTVTSSEQKEARLTEITKRIEEIRSMDKSQLTRAERKDIRRELRDMKKQAREGGGYIYLSVGAVIIIILLLIIIL